MLKKRVIDFFQTTAVRISAYSPLTKVALVMILSSFVITLGYGIRLAFNPGQVAEITNIPVTPPVITPVINWQTPSVTLIADKIEITTNTQGEGYLDKVFLANPTNISNFTLRSDAPDNNRDYTTLEATWTENDVEMRLYMYFEAYLEGGSRKWRLNQVNTYNGNNPGNWVDSYSGGSALFTSSPIGSSLEIPFVELSTSGGGYFHLKFTNLRLQAFLEEANHCYYQSVQCIQAPCNPVLVCNPPSPSPSLSPSPSPSQSPACNHQSPLISIGPGNPSGQPGETITYSVGITNQDTQSCGSSQFSFNTLVPSGFSSNQPMYSAPIQAGGTFNTTFTVTSPLVNPWNETRSIPVTFSATNMQSNLSSSINAAYTLLMPKPQTFDMYFKLAGVTAGGADGAKVNVKFYLKNGTVLSLSEPLTLTYGTDGVYHTSATISNPFPAGTEFRIKVKGEKHIAVEYCRASAQTGPCGDNEYIVIPPTGQDNFMLSFVNIPLPPGDLSIQDGKADIEDLNKLKPLMGKAQSSLTDADLLIGDVNYDNFINIYDVFLILKTVETRYDD